MLLHRSSAACAARASIVAFTLYASGAAAQGPLYAGRQFPTAPDPYDAVARDFNGDGHDDLAVICRSSNQCQLLTGDGKGAFSLVQTTPLFQGPAACCAADFTGDAIPDVVVTLDGGGWGQPGQAIDLLVSGPGGGFISTLALPIPTHATPFQPSATEAGDVNGDGIADLVVFLRDIQGGQHAVATYVSASGTALSSMKSQPYADIPFGFAMADVNGDGVLDLLVADYLQSRLTVMIGTGTGSFGQGAWLAVQQEPTAAACADFDSDGKIDVAVAHWNSPVFPSMTVARGDGHGGFLGANTYISPGYCNDVVAVDLDGDLDVDIAVASANATVAIFRNGGGGQFAAADAVPGGAGPRSLLAGDWNHDGLKDLAVVDDYNQGPFAGVDPGMITVLLSSASETGAGASQQIAVAPFPRLAVCGDLNHDGRADLVTTAKNAVAVHLGGPSGFTAAGSYNSTFLGESLVLTDIDGDGREDVVVAHTDSAKLGVRVGNGAGAFGAEAILAVGSTPSPVAAGDLNLDGAVDLVSADQGSQQLSVFLGNGAGGFLATPPYPVGGTYPKAAMIGDLDGDGVPDLAAVLTTPLAAGASFVTFSGTGFGGFLGPKPGPIVQTATAAALGDVDGDGLLDAVVAVSTPPGIHYNLVTLRNLGAGLFTASGTAPLDQVPRAVALGDLNADGYCDASVTCDLADRVIIAFGGPSGFQTEDAYAVFDAPFGLTIADLDGDGGLDLVVGAAGGTTLLTLKHAPAASAGLTPFGAGTPGCRGAHATAASGPLQVGNASFRLSVTQGPPSALGAMLVTDAPDLGGNAALVPGIVFHVDLVASSWVALLDLRTDPSGTASFPIPVPANPALAGATAFAQPIFLWPPDAECDPSLLRLSSGRGVRLSIIP